MHQCTMHEVVCIAGLEDLGEPLVNASCHADKTRITNQNTRAEYPDHAFCAIWGHCNLGLIVWTQHLTHCFLIRSASSSKNPTLLSLFLGHAGWLIWYAAIAGLTDRPDSTLARRRPRHQFCGYKLARLSYYCQATQSLTRVWIFELFLLAVWVTLLLTTLRRSQDREMETPWMRIYGLTCHICVDTDSAQNWSRWIKFTVSTKT